MGQRQFGSILTNFLQFWTHTTRPNVTKLFREVVLWLGGGTTCFWNERGVDAEFQSWEEGFWEPTGLVGKRGGEVSPRSGRAPHLPSPQQEPRVFEKAHSLSLPVLSQSSLVSSKLK